MDEQRQFLPPAAETALENWFAQIRLARATELAESGRLLEAEAILAHNGELPDNPRELDLLARIAARQGRFDEARLRWNAALEREPGNQTYHQCLEHLTPGRRIARLIANSQDTLLEVVVWTTIAFAVAALLFVFRQ